MTMTNVEQLCDALDKSLTGTHGFECAGEAFGFDGEYIFIEWRTAKNGSVTTQPTEQDSLGYKLNDIGKKFGYQIIYMQARSFGTGNFYFKPLI